MEFWQKLWSAVRHPGSFPVEARELLQSESVLLGAEGVRITVIYRNFRGPGMYSNYKRAGSYGCFALSAQRVMAFSFMRPIIHVPFAEPAFHSLKIRAEEDKYLSVVFDPSLFDPRQSGSTELRFYLPNVSRTAGILASRGGNVEQ
jgi:hypothetical protein